MVAGHCFRLVEKDSGSSDKRKESQPFSSSRKKQKTSTSHEAKAMVNHLGVGGTSVLLVSQGR